MFPEFNIYSTTLLIFQIQGLLFALLLFIRYVKKRFIADLFIAALLFIMAYHRTSYTIGFMGWYDTFRDTKINYYLLNFELLIGPLIFFYVNALLLPKFKFKKKHSLHFLPFLIYFIYRVVIYIHDSNHPGWETGFNGDWEESFNQKYMLPVFQLISYTSYLLYFAFTIQAYIYYRKKIKHFFSNTYKLELNWIAYFISIYVFLFVYSSLQAVVDEFFLPLRWIDTWWIHFLSGIAVVYLGIKAYMTNLSSLYTLTFQIPSKNEISDTNKNYDEETRRIKTFIKSSQSFLNPELSLPELAKQLNININELSEIINQGIGKNFNDFINGYRVQHVKQEMLKPEKKHLSLLGIAYESGFNSKATFNRVFKKIEGCSPSQFLISQKRETT